jgi:TonB-linked SusC/RagA family outer membrane protein
MKRKSFTPKGLASRTGVLASAFAATLLILGTAPASAQEGAIEGTVQNASTVALDAVNNASVFVEGTNISTLTDRQGRYRLTEVPAGQVTVQVTIIGFRAASQSVTVQAGQVVTLDFQLEVSAVRLDEVYVDVLTGTQRARRELSTNVGTLNVEEEVPMAVVKDVGEVLTGRIPGVIVLDVNGSVGSAQKIRIRGSNSLSLSNEPLIIVDGIYYSNDLSAPISAFTGGQQTARLNDINPNEIASVEVIKGPAASALYGAIGANGVILITTRRGAPGGTDWHFYGEFGGSEDRTDYPLNFEAVTLDPGGDPNAPVFTEDGFNFDNYTRCENFEAGAGNCTQDQFLSFSTTRDPRTTMIQKGDSKVFGLNVSGGTPIATYFISGEYEKANGVVDFDFNNTKSFSVRANVDAALLNTVDMSVSIGFVSRGVNFTNNDNSLFSPLINMIGGMAGFVPGPDDNGGPNKSNYLFARNLTDLGEASLGTQDTDRFTGSASLNWQPFSWLSATGTFGLDLFSTFDFVTIQPGLDDLASDWVDGFRDATRFQRQNWTGTGSVNATYSLGGVLATSTAGVSYQEELLNGVECFGAGLISGTDSCASTSARFFVDELFSNVVTLGTFFQQEFVFGNRLFLRGSFRVDDNSNFGGNLGAEIYPSAGFSYVMSDESWFSTGNFISELRFRGAYGVAGVRPAFRDAITLFGPVTATVGGSDVPGVTLSETGNELLKPERTTEYEGGFDIGMLRDRLGLAFTYYQSRSKDALIAVPLAPSFGLTTTVFQNLGEVQNKGIELQLRALALDQRKARIGFELNWTTFNNTVIDLGEGVEPIIFSRGTQRHENGFPAGAYWDNEFTFNDANGDGLLSRDEVTVLDDEVFVDESTPTYEVAFILDMTFFEAIQINTLFDARGGHSLNNFTERFRCQRFLSSGRGCEATGGQNAPLEEQARFIASRFTSPTLTTNIGYFEEAKFLKWRELSVTFFAPPSLADKVPLLRRTSLTFAGRNLQTWTGYTGFDPEINETGGNSNFTAGDFNTQPPVRLLTVRLDIRF